MLRKHVTTTMVLLIAWLSNRAAAQPIDFHCGTGFLQQLELPASIYWSEVPLREGLENLSRTQRLAIWLDRRVVPNRPVTVAAKESTLRDCLAVIARSEKLEIAWADCVVYAGPKTAADRFATVNHLHTQMVAKLAETPRRLWQARKASSWPRLTVPAELVAEIEQEVGRRIAGREQIPHDLWPAAQWPSLPAYTRLGLILAGFDLTVLFNQDGSARIVPMPTRPRFRQTYRVPAHQRPAIQELVASFPAAKVVQTGGRAELAASWQVHDAVQNALRPARQQPPAEQTRYTLRGVNQPLGPLLEQLARRLELTCEFSAAAMRHYEDRVSFEARQVARDELFRTILAETPLRADLHGSVLRVRLKSE